MLDQLYQLVASNLLQLVIFLFQFVCFSSTFLFVSKTCVTQYSIIPLWSMKNVSLIFSHCYFHMVFGPWIGLFSGLVCCRLLLPRLGSCQLCFWQVFPFPCCAGLVVRQGYSFGCDTLVCLGFSRGLVLF